MLARGPARPDRGKRIPNVPHVYKQWDYLKDDRPEEEKKTHPIGVADPRSRFKVGFFRRPGALIHESLAKDLAERDGPPEQRRERVAKIAQMRAQARMEVERRNGDILHPTPAVEKLFETRRQFPNREAEVHRQGHLLQKKGPSRFHLEMTSEEKEQRLHSLSRRYSDTQSQSRVSVLGYGRQDLASNGTVDNWHFRPYTQQDILSRPKLKSVTSASETTVGAAGAGAGGSRSRNVLRSSIGVRITDGSDSIGRAPSTSSSPSNNTRIWAGGLARSTKNNATSSALRDVFVWENNSSNTNNNHATHSRSASTPTAQP